MKTATKVIFTSALMLSVVAPTLSHAAYLVDQTKTSATNTRAQDVMDKVTRHKERAAQKQDSRRGVFEFYGSDNTSVPGASFEKDDTIPR
jgi:hypothetical protein